MANCAICWPNKAGGSSVFSGGSWLPSLPLANLVDETLSKPARSTDVLTTSTKFTVILEVPTFVRVIALLRHNLSLSAQMNMTVYEDDAGESVMFSTGLIDVWPSLFESEDKEWEDDEFWNGTISEDELGAFPKLWLKVFDERQLAKRIDFEFVDVTNTDNYVEIGGIYVALDWQPVTNISWGASLGWNDNSEISETWNGTEHARERAKFRMLTGALEFMDESEAVNKALLMTADRGVTKDVFFIWDTDDTTYLMQRSFLGRLLTLSPVTAYNWSVNSMPIQIKERI